MSKAKKGSSLSEEYIIKALKNPQLKKEELEELISTKTVREKKILLIKALSHKKATPTLFLQYAKLLYPHDLLTLSKQPTINIFVKNEVLRYLGTLYEKMPKGERKNILRRVPIEFLRYVKEKDWKVFSSILLNPRLTESKLIEILTQKKPGKEFIDEVLNSTRWKSRRRILFSLFTLPYFPDFEAVKRLKYLSFSQLNYILKNPSISQNIKKEAKKQILKIKKRAKGI